MPETNILTLRLDSKLKKKLDKLAKATDRSRSFLAAEAIREFVALNEWQIDQIKKAVEQADAQKFASPQQVQQARQRWKRRAS
jgi:predicted transcriptional regulator